MWPKCPADLEVQGRCCGGSVIMSAQRRHFPSVKSDLKTDVFPLISKCVYIEYVQSRRRAGKLARAALVTSSFVGQRFVELYDLAIWN